MKTIRQRYLINASLEKVWQALVDPKIIEKWGGGPAKMNDKVGTKFSLWGGDIHGENLEVLENKKLVQDWFGGKWEKPSKVTFILKEVEGRTELELQHVDVPDEEVDDIDQGWRDYYLGPLKALLESS